MSEEVKLTVNGGSSGRPTRREAMQWVLAAVAASAAPDAAFGQTAGRAVPPQESANKSKEPIPKGYGVDPNLRKNYEPGEFWPLTFDEAQKKAAAALADTIIPEDELGPAASDVGVVEMVDEWVSAPYDEQRGDRPIVIEGLAWIDSEAKRRFKKVFADLAEAQRHAICDDVCFARTAKAEFKQAARFFSKFRSLCAAAYYATPAGWKAIGYVGNVQLPAFNGPPKEVLERLGVEQTVK